MANSPIVTSDGSNLYTIDGSRIVCRGEDRVSGCFPTADERTDFSSPLSVADDHWFAVISRGGKRGVDFIVDGVLIDTIDPDMRCLSVAPCIDVLTSILDVPFDGHAALNGKPFVTPLTATVTGCLIGGGGAGGLVEGGGGGGGQVFDNITITVTAGVSYDVFVGLGGIDTNGGDTLAFGRTAFGGGKGGDAGPNPGQRGASGGGGTGDGVPGGTAAAGFPGGTGSFDTGLGNNAGGGGGGASEPGQDAEPTVGGDGGHGTIITIGGLVERVGGGGGGCADLFSGSGHDGGGDGGAGGNPGTDGTPGTGGGGGGGTNHTGGSGRGIVRYATGTLVATGGTITTDGGDTIHTFTVSGVFTVTSVAGTPITKAFLDTRNERMWSRALSLADVTTEAGSAVPVDTTDIVSNVGLTNNTDLVDTIGAHNFSIRNPFYYSNPESSGDGYIRCDHFDDGVRRNVDFVDLAKPFTMLWHIRISDTPDGDQQLDTRLVGNGSYLLSPYLRVSSDVGGTSFNLHIFNGYEDPCCMGKPTFWTSFDTRDPKPYNAGVRPLRDAGTFYDGYKEGRVLSVSTASRASSDWLSGSWQSQRLTSRYADTDYKLRGGVLNRDRYSLSEQRNSLYLIDDDRRNNPSAVARLLFQGLIYEDPLTDYLSVSLTTNDIISVGYNLFKQEKQTPQRVILSDDFPNAPVTVLGMDGNTLGVPIVYGNVSDEGPLAKGSLSLINIGNNKALVSGHAIKALLNLYTRTNDAGVLVDPSKYTLQNGITINGRCYTLVTITDATLAGLFGAGTPIFANLQGIETTGDGSGTLITDLHQQYLHLLVNWLIGNYQAGLWEPPSYFEDYPGLNRAFNVDAASFYAASAIANSMLPGGYVGSFVLGANGRRIQVRQAIQDANICTNSLLGLNQYSQLFIRMLPLRRSEFFSFQAPNRNVRMTHILKDNAPITSPRRDWLANNLTYQFKQDYVSGRWLGSDRVFDTSSIDAYGDQPIKRQYALVQDAATARTIAQQHVRVSKDPPSVFTWSMPLCGLWNGVLDPVAITHYSGRGSAGYINRAMWILKQDIEQKSARVNFTALDVERLFI